MLQGDSVVLETLDILVKTNEGDVCVRILGNDQREDRCHIVLSDIFATISYYINLHAGVGKVVGKIDDIDHLSNRRLRLIGELLQNQFRMGMVKVEKNIRDRMSTSAEVKSVTAQNLVNIRPLTSTFREFLVAVSYHNLWIKLILFQSLLINVVCQLLVKVVFLVIVLVLRFVMFIHHIMVEFVLLKHQKVKILG